MKKTKINKLEFAIAIILLLTVLCVVCCEAEFHAIRNSIGYVGRSALLILLGGVTTFFIYKVGRQRRKYAVRTSEEVLDDLLEAGIWRQLGQLFVLSLIAFIFSWLLIDGFLPVDVVNEGNMTADHNTFWLTICYFLDAGNVNLTPREMPGWQGLVSLVVAVLGMTLLTGLFISTFTNVMDRRRSLVRAGLVTYPKIKNHTVVIGFCNLTEGILYSILWNNEDQKVILLTNYDIEDVRKSLFSLLNNKLFDGRIVLYSGDYRLMDTLRRLNVPAAKSVLVLGDDDMKSRDYVNLTTAQLISKICGASPEPRQSDELMPLFVRMDSLNSFSTLQRLNIDEKFFQGKVYFRPFNYYEHWARGLWTRHKVFSYEASGEKRIVNYPPLFFDKTERGQKRYVHLVVSGFSEMGMAITLQAIRLAHYANNVQDKTLRTRITIVDPNMDGLKGLFTSQFRHLEQIYDIDIEFRNCNLEDMDKELIEWSLDEQRMLTIAICLDDSDASLAQGLSLPLEVYYQYGRLSSELPRILVRQQTMSGLWNELDERRHEELIGKEDDAAAFRKAQYNKYRNVYPFGMLKSGFYQNDLDDLKACLMNADYEDTWVNTDKPENEKLTVANLYAQVKEDNKERVCEMVQKAMDRWNSLQENVKWANRYQTDIHKDHKELLNSAGIYEPSQITEANEDVFYMCSNVEHRRWVAERVLSGWQQSPVVRNGKPMRQDALLLHYDITPYIGKEKLKDEAVVRNILMLDVIFDYYKNNR